MTAQNGAGRIVTDGLVYLIDPGNKRSYPGSGSTVYDIGGSDATTTLVGSPTYNDIGAFNLDGSTQYMTLNWPISLTPWSMSFWINIGTLSGTVEKEIVAVTGNGFIILVGLNASIWKFILWNGSVSLLTSVAVDVGVWQNLTMTYDGSTTLRWFNNGVQTLFHSPYTIPTGSGTMWIGNNPDNTNRYFPGKMSHISFYNRQLSAAEVKQNFEALRERYKI